MTLPSWNRELLWVVSLQLYIKIDPWTHSLSPALSKNPFLALPEKIFWASKSCLHLYCSDSPSAANSFPVELQTSDPPFFSTHFRFRRSLKPSARMPSRTLHLLQAPNPLPKDPEHLLIGKPSDTSPKTGHGRTWSMMCLSLETCSKFLLRVTRIYVAGTFETRCEDPRRRGGPWKHVSETQNTADTLQTRCGYLPERLRVSQIPSDYQKKRRKLQKYARDISSRKLCESGGREGGVGEKLVHVWWGLLLCPCASFKSTISCRISAADLESKVGRFYVFAQKMAGLDDDGDGSKNSQLCDLIHFVVGRIRSRVRSRCTLARITHSLRMFLLSVLVLTLWN